MNLTLNKQQQSSLIWMMDEFIKTHSSFNEFDTYAKDISTAKYILTKLTRVKDV